MLAGLLLGFRASNSRQPCRIRRGYASAHGLRRTAQTNADKLLITAATAISIEGSRTSITRLRAPTLLRVPYLFF